MDRDLTPKSYNFVHFHILMPQMGRLKLEGSNS